MPREVVVLLSVGAHPVSLRARVADADGRALGLARAVSDDVTALHAGPAALAASLRPCLGMGATRLIVLNTPGAADPLPALAQWLATARPALVLAGDRAEAGDGSGMAPFWLSDRLGWPLVANAVGLEWAAGVLHLTQALPRGRRRVLEAAPPLLATVGRTARPAPLSATGPSLRGTIRCEVGYPAPPDPAGEWSRRPARIRPRALTAPGTVAGSASATADTARREMIAPDPTVAADAILDLLARESLIAVGPGERTG